jgi:hypothetical protein
MTRFWESAEIKQLREENQALRQMAQWLKEAQERSENTGKREAKYLDTAPKAVELMQNPAFNTAYNDLVVDLQRKMLNSQPQEQELRETCYLETQLLQKILLKLDYQVKVAENSRLKAVQ